MTLSAFVTISTKGASGTSEVGSALAEHLRPGDVVLLNGDLATGKTTFVKALVEALGSSQPVTSPTFTLAQFYNTGRATVLHIDTYRLASIHEFRDLGLETDIEDSITLIEWGDKVATDFPCALTVEFTYDVSAPDLRLLTISANCNRMAETIKNLMESAQIS